MLFSLSIECFKIQYLGNLSKTKNLNLDTANGAHLAGCKVGIHSMWSFFSVVLGYIFFMEIRFTWIWDSIALCIVGKIFII